MSYPFSHYEENMYYNYLTLQWILDIQKTNYFEILAYKLLDIGITSLYKLQNFKS